MRETEANARLIAAAPEMFEVCKLLLESESLARGDMNDYARSWDMLIEAVAKARAVVEKVRDEQ
jgi:hypothetical protein